MWDTIKNMLGFGEPDGTEHPAARKVVGGWEATKHVLGGAIRTAAKWAMVGGMILGGLAILPSGITAIPVIGPVIGAILGSGTPGQVLWAGLKTGLMYGAVAGGIKGGLSSVASADEAIANAKEQAILNADRYEARLEKQQLFAMRTRGQAPGMNIQTPNVGYAQGHNKGMGLGE